jgi:hypothetical protein
VVAFWRSRTKTQRHKAMQFRTASAHRVAPSGYATASRSRRTIAPWDDDSGLVSHSCVVNMKDSARPTIVPMKNLFLALLLTGSAFAADAESTDQRIARIMEEAQMKRFDGYAKVDREYRAAISTTFKFADRVEVYLLDFSIGKDAAYRPKKGDEVFLIRPY